MSFELQPYQQEIVDGLWARVLAVAEAHLIIDPKELSMNVALPEPRRETKNDRLLLQMDALRWHTSSMSPHESYRRERQHIKLVRKAIAKKLIEP